MEVEVLRIFVLPWHAGMECGQSVPTDTPFDLLHGFCFPDQDPHGLAIHGIASLQLSNGEGG
jgi:hypothetical protein